MFAIHQQSRRYKKKGVECMSGLCLHLGIENGSDIRRRQKDNKFNEDNKANKDNDVKFKESSLLDDQQTPKCPANVPIFFSAANNDDETSSLNASGQQQHQSLNELLEQCIQQGQTAIGQLELFRARGPSALQKICEAFNGAQMNMTEDDDEEKAEEEEKEGEEEGKAEKKKKRMLFVEQFVAQVKAQYELARHIEKVLPSLLEELCQGCLHPEEAVPCERLLSRNFAKLLEIAVRFDSLKMETPALQNGFSMHRRLILLNSFGSSDQLLYAHLGDQISLFLSRPTPLLISLVNGAERFIGRQLGRELAISHVVETLLVIYNVLKRTLERRRQLNLVDDTSAHNPVGEFILRAMVALLLLYDHIERSPGGVFNAANSPFDVVEFVAVVQRNCTIEKAHTHLATLRFMSRHFNDRETPSHVRRLFND